MKRNKNDISIAEQLRIKLSPNHNDDYRHRCSFYDWDYTYQSYHPCHNGSNCCDGDYCRCGQITNTQIKSGPKEGIVNSIIYSLEGTKDYPLSELLLYCIERILVSEKIYELNKWGCKIEGGYYGQEVNGVKFTGNVAAIIEKVKKLESMSDNQRIEFILNNEYGHLPEHYQNKEWRIEEVKRAKIIIVNNNHYTKLKDNPYFGQDRLLPICVLLKQGDNYSIVDGYHRLAANSEEEIIVVVGNFMKNKDGNYLDGLGKDICGYCKKYRTKEGYDGCIGKLENVKNACCGHGETKQAYVQFDHDEYDIDSNKYRISGQEAIDFIIKSRSLT